MVPMDAGKFQSTMGALAEVFAKQLSPPLIELYWDALKTLTIEQFQQGAKSWIRHGKHFPKPTEILERFRDMEQAASKPAPPPLPDYPKWLGFVNGLFLRYLLRRRVDEGFTGDIDIRARRMECLKLADFFEALEAEHDPEATEAELKKRFDLAMLRVPDAQAKAA